MTVTILKGDCRDVLATLPAESVHCVVTSPPYFGLRDYGVAGQIGLEPSPEAFTAELVKVFASIRPAMRGDGTVWLNLGDSYTPVNRGENARPRRETMTGIQVGNPHADIPTRKDMIQAVASAGLKQKDLMGIPWRVAFALQADGWYLRQDIIWSKPNPMPESVRDRCTKAHEYLFLLSKSERYHYDADVISEPVECDRLRGSGPMVQPGTGRNDVTSNGDYRKRSGNKERKPAGLRGIPGASTTDSNGSVAGSIPWEGTTRNKRSVWTVNTAPFPEAHFATFPPELIEPCILAGCPKGGTVLDPFGRRWHDRACRGSAGPQRHPDRAQPRLCRHGRAPHPRRCRHVRGGCDVMRLLYIQESQKP